MGVEERFLQVLRHPAAGEVGQAGDGVAQLLDLPPAFGAGGQVRFHSHSELRWKIPFEIVSQRDLDALAAERLYHPTIIDPVTQAKALRKPSVRRTGLCLRTSSGVTLVTSAFPEAA